MRTPSIQSSDLPEGFILIPDFLTEAEQAGFLELLAGLSYGEVRMRGVAAKRRVAQFGWHYSFESYRLLPAPPPPAELDNLRLRAAGIAGIAAEQFAETLVTEYQPGA